MEQQGTSLLQFLPIVIVTIPIGIITLLLAKRKGRLGFVWKIVGFIPFIGWYPLIYLLGITDKAIYDKLDEISEVLERRTQ